MQAEVFGCMGDVPDASESSDESFDFASHMQSSMEDESQERWMSRIAPFADSSSPHVRMEFKSVLAQQ